MSVSFVDANIGTTVGGTIILRTVDGGDTWTRQSTGFDMPLNSVSLVDANVGFAVAGHISFGWAGGAALVRTDDGGATWRVVSAPACRPCGHFCTECWAWFGVAFVNAERGWAVGVHTYAPLGFLHQGAISGFGGSGGFLGPGGVGIGSTSHLNAISAVDANTATAVGIRCDYDAPCAGVIMRTNNGGAAWTSQFSGTTQELASVSFADANNGWVVGSNGTLLHTTNGGE